MVSPSPDEETAFHGVTLSRFAAVRAALAEPFVLRRVLSVEGLALADWRLADIAWKKHLTRHQESLLPRYRTELAAAEDWLLRIVTPLHEDIEAWADFLCAFTLRPAEVLRHAQMSTNDVSRLLRFWSAQTAKDSSLASRAEARMKRGFVTLPRIEPEPRKLRRSRGSASSPLRPESAPPSIQPSRPRSPEPLAPLAQPSTEAPPLSGQAPSSAPLPSFMAAQARAAALAANASFGAPSVPARPDATGTQDVSAFLEAVDLPFDPHAPPSVPEASPRSAPPAEKAPRSHSSYSIHAGGTQDISALLASGPFSFPDRPSASPDVAATQDVSALLASGPLPFVDKPSASPDVAATQDLSALLASGPLPFVNKPSASPDVSATQDLSAFLAAGPAPFSDNPSASPDVAATLDLSAFLAAGPAPFSDEPSAALDATGTQDVSAFLAAAPLPFEKAASTADPGGTQDVSALLAGPSLPFGGPPPAPPAPPPPAPASLHSPPAPASLHSPPAPPPPASLRSPPAPAPPASLHSPPAPAPPASLHSPPAPAPPASLHSPSAPPPPAPLHSPPAPASLRSPSAPSHEMPLRQYASLCVDIGNRPDKSADTLARYRLSPETKRSLDNLYRDRFVADPTLFGEFRRACDAYQTWLSQQPAPPPASRVAPSPHSAPPPSAARVAPSPQSAPPPPASRVAPSPHSAPPPSAARVAPSPHSAPPPPASRVAPSPHSAPPPSASRVAPSPHSAPPPPAARVAPSPHAAPPPAPASLPQLTIDQYAAVTVDLQLAPAHRASVLQRHRLTEPLIAALDADWARYLAADPAARAAYHRAADTYRAWRLRGH